MEFMSRIWNACDSRQYLVLGNAMAKLFKKDEKFFKIFGQMTVYILEAAEILGNHGAQSGG